MIIRMDRPLANDHLDGSVYEVNWVNEVNSLNGKNWVNLVNWINEVNA